jgi:uncharacterized protein (TIGR02246 family)
MESMMPEAKQQDVNADSALATMLERFTRAFNRFDGKEVASFWADDGTLISPNGDYGRGRSGVAEVFVKDCDTVLDGTTSKFTIVGTRQIGADCVFLDLDHDIQNARLPDGSSGTLKLHVVILAQRKGNSWQWLDARPYAFLPPPERMH